MDPQSSGRQLRGWGRSAPGEEMCSCKLHECMRATETLRLEKSFLGAGGFPRGTLAVWGLSRPSGASCKSVRLQRLEEKRSASPSSLADGVLT